MIPLCKSFQVILSNLIESMWDELDVYYNNHALGVATEFLALLLGLSLDIKLPL